MINETNIIEQDFLDKERKGFLAYSGAVITARALPLIQDGLKPIQRRILYTLYKTKLTSDKEAKKSAATVGEVLKLSAHGDQASYQAMVRLAQWWKLRYPLCEGQGNMGNLIGSPAAAMRYTNMKLSPVGDFMLEDIDKECVDFKPNYDESMEEPCTLPGKFPNLLCNNSKGISVGYSCNFASHNFTEVKNAIQYYMEHQDCSIKDLMNFIEGPDFPTGGRITNAEKLPEIYSTGYGSITLEAHYDIKKIGVGKTAIIFHDVPYGIEINEGVLFKIREKILNEDINWIEDYNAEKGQSNNFDITVVINSRIISDQNAVEYLFKNTGLRQTFTINQTAIVDNKPKLLNLKELIKYWVDYRSSIIRRIAQHKYDKTNDALTIILGLQKCMSDIDKLISIVRNADSRAIAKSEIMKVFSLTDVQADAVLDMKLSKLSKLDLIDLNKDQKNKEDTLAALKNIIDNEKERYLIINRELNEIKKAIGEDKRITEINYANLFTKKEAEQNSSNANNASASAAPFEFLVFNDGTVNSTNNINTANINLVADVREENTDNIFGYTKTGLIGNINHISPNEIIGASVKKDNDTLLVCVTKNGNIKVSKVEDYKLKSTSKGTNALKLKEGDELFAVFFAHETDRLYLLTNDEDGKSRVLCLAINSLPIASKLTIGVKSGFTKICGAACPSSNEVLLFVDKNNKAKFTNLTEFTVDNRGNKGQLVNDNVIHMSSFNTERKTIYGIGLKKLYEIPSSKISNKSRTASGASLTSNVLTNII